MAFSAADIAKWIGGKIENPEIQTEPVDRPAPLGESSAGHVAFFFSKEYQHELPGSRASVLITGTPFIGPMRKAGLPLWETTNVISVPDPYVAMGVVLEKFAHSESSELYPVLKKGGGKVHPTAVVDASVKLGPDTIVGPHVVMGHGVTVGARTVIHAGAYLGPQVRVGEDCSIFYGVKIYESVKIGNRVRIHAGAVIGADGFGYAPLMEGGQPRGHQKIYHLGGVLIGNDVEIGANATIDRGTIADTVLSDFVKIDNHVQIAHNVTLGEGTIVCGTTAFAGSSSAGKYVYVGGITGISNRVHLHDFSKVGACSLISKDVPKHTTALGNPQREYREHFRAHAALNRLGTGKRRKVEKDH